jgi:MYXO-CTERM domain-containing protein
VQVPTYENDDPFPVGEVEELRYDWHWLALPDASDGSSPRFGFANLAYFDTRDENSERLLLGWSPATRTQGITDEYVVSEVDRQGQLRGEPLTLDGAGWGEDNRWVTMPSSGCVVFPFAWAGDSGPGGDYPLEGQEPSAYPTVMHLTSLCPVGEQPAPADAGQGPSPYDPSPDGGAGPSAGAPRDTDSGCGCRAPVRSTPKGVGMLAALAVAALLGRSRRRGSYPRT